MFVMRMIYVFLGGFEQQFESRARLRMFYILALTFFNSFTPHNCSN